MRNSAGQYFPSFPHTFSRITVWRHSKKCWTVFPFVHHCRNTHTLTHKLTHVCMCVTFWACFAAVSWKQDRIITGRIGTVLFHIPAAHLPKHLPSPDPLLLGERERNVVWIRMSTFIYTTTDLLHRNKQENATIVKRIWFSFKQKTIESLFSSVQFSVNVAFYMAKKKNLNIQKIY